ncbi:MAG: DNA-processing protein DprA [Gemmataceae bacterium]|nr:DNA-processing protein DprA [Gemmataceae bacterium]
MGATDSRELDDLLALALVPGLGPRLTTSLLQRFGSAAAIRRLSAEQLRSVPHIGDKLSRQFQEALARVDVERERALLQKHGVRLVRRDTPEYPARLATVNDAPHLLFLRGEVLASDSRAVAIVGSRGMTSYGRRVTENIARGLAKAGYTIVSGLARGVDGVAHQAALEAGGRTIAVLAGGLSRIYPPEHADLAEAVAASGALMTETPMQMEPQAGMFPARNRLISALSLGVIVVEANERSGALITARHALEQNREVFAVPGPVDAAASAGCLGLIRAGAKLVRHADDVMEDLHGIGISVAPGPAAKPESAPAAAPPPEMNDLERSVWDALDGGPVFVDQMVLSLAVGVPELTRALMGMELKRIIRRLPGNRYERR